LVRGCTLRELNGVVVFWFCGALTAGVSSCGSASSACRGAIRLLAVVSFLLGAKLAVVLSLIGSGKGRDRKDFLESESDCRDVMPLLVLEPPLKPISLPSRCIPKPRNKNLLGFAPGTRKMLRLNGCLETASLEISLDKKLPAPEIAFILAGN
jgi:hypothetical protein